MNLKELKELIEFLIEKDISEFELERGDVKVRIKRGGVEHVSGAPVPIGVHATSVPAVPVASAANNVPATQAAAEAAAAKPPEEKLHIVHSPIVGTYYESPSPGSPPFIAIGDKVEAGQVLCIVEAMKLMNEIESDATGEIVKKLVSNGQPVEYGQELFAIRTGS
jgi:acetyl-CoA carboxylase biotin carboxyl carrier protein